MQTKLLVGICFLSSFCITAQTLNTPVKKLKIPASIANRAVRIQLGTHKIIPNPSLANSASSIPTPSNSNVVGAHKANSNNSSLSYIAGETTIGTTTYQLQTNSSVRNGLFKGTDGTVSAVWTYSSETSAASNPYADRGAGYAFYNGTSWSAIPTARVEAARTGWPNIVVTSTGEEVFVVHNTVVPALELVSRPAKGTGVWAQSTTSLPSPITGSNWWPRMAVGSTVAADGSNTVLHEISITYPVLSGGQKYNHQSGALCYSRSQNGGATWDIINQVSPLLDSAAGFFGFGGDEYAIDAHNATVAYVAGSWTTDLVLMKSTDAGSTWTKTTILKFPIRNWNGQITDSTGAGVTPDTLNVSDGSYAVLLDKNNMAHIWYGAMRILNSRKNDSLLTSYFPGTQGLMYWNESMAKTTPVTAPYAIEGLVQYSAADTFSHPPSPALGFGDYQVSLTSHPTAGIDTAGTIYLAYDAVIPGSDDGSYSTYTTAFRDIYITSSSDEGKTWRTAYRCDSNNDIWEQVYPSMARYVNNCASLIFQQDQFAGTTFATGSADVSSNSGQTANIIYSCVNTTGLNGIKENSSVLVSVNNYPNPFKGKTTINVTLTKSTSLTVDVYNTLGQKVLSTGKVFLSAGAQSLMIDATNFEPGVYFYTLRTPDTSITNKMSVQ